MDKAERALRYAEDVGAAMEAVQSKLPMAVGGNAKDGVTSFGKINAKSGGVAVILFDGGEAGAEFCGEEIARGGSPLFAALVPGRGELKLTAERENSRALIFYVK